MKRESRNKPRHYWTPEDDKMLIGGIDTMTFGELCRTLGREPIRALPVRGAYEAAGRAVLEGVQ